MKEYTDEYLIEIAKELDKLLKEESHENSNLVDEFHPNENAHSRILRMLLEYNDGNGYPIFQSFIQGLTERQISTPNFQIKEPKFTNEEDRIDLLIEDSSYGIIIENKINGAIDQKKQLEKYLTKMGNRGFSGDQLYVIYLTSDGEKKVSKNSFTDKAKQILGYKSEEEPGRFIAMDFRYDILPWLENDILPYRTPKEDLLTSSIKIYIDYLKGMFNLRISNEKINNKICDIMELDNKGIEEIWELGKQIQQLSEEMKEIINKRICKEITDKLIKPLEKDLKEKYGEKLALKVIKNNGNRYNLEIQNSDWKTCILRVTNKESPYYSYMGISYITEDVIGKNEDSISIVQKKLKGYKSTVWFPCWKYLNKIRTDDKQFIESLSKGDFEKDVLFNINDIMDATSGIKL